MEKQFASFYLGNSLFGIDVLLIREINRNLDITHVDPAPDFIVGLMNLRGQIVTVVDSGVRLNLGRREITQSSCCIVLKTNRELQRYKSEGFEIENTSNDIVGLMVDKIGDMIHADKKDIEPPPANAYGVDGKYLDGVIKLEKELLITLKMEEILSHEMA